MPEDLKTMLTKVLHSKGKKTFFFAYGTGKRSDGNGDGHLVVAGMKPKKTEVQESCACQAFFEGLCWSSTDGDTVFYQSKSAKLSTANVAKMALTAKKQSGRQFDFQVPSAEEEARAEKLGETNDSKPEAEIPKAPPPPSDGRGNEAAWKKRREAIEPRLLAALKEQRGDASKMRAVFAFALEKAGAGDYGPALAALGNIEKLLDAAPSSDGGKKEASAAFQARLKTLVAQVTKSGAKGQALADMKLLVSESQAFERKQDFAKAGAVLDRLADALKTNAEKGETDESPFRKEWAAARSELRKAIDSVSDQLEEFANALLDDPDPGRVWIAEHGLSEVLSSLRDPAFKIDRATSKTPEKLAAKAKPSIAELKAELKSERVKACDANKLGVRVTIATTIGKAIKRLEAAIA